MDAITCFQQLERLPVTGKIEPSGRCIAQLSRKLPANTGTMLARISSTATQTTKHYTIASGVSLTLAVEKKVARIAAAYHAVTGKKIQITSGTRTPAAQAKAMFANMKNGDRLTIYQESNARRADKKRV